MFRSRGGFVEAAGKPSKWQQWHTFLVLAGTKVGLLQISSCPSYSLLDPLLRS